MPKCKNCGKEIDKDIAYKVGKASYYCNERCYNNKLEKQNTNKRIYKPKENTDRRDLTDYIQKIYLENGYDKSEINWTMICSQIKNILQDYNKWTYVTLQYILYYMYEILEINLFAEESKGSILTLIPFYGQEAEQYYYQNCEIENSIKNFDFNDNIIKIKKKTQKKKYKEIDLTNI